MISQGLVLMLAGMSIVYLFLITLIIVTKLSMKGISNFDSILPQDAPKKKPAVAATDDDANIALAIAVALNG